MKETRAAPDVFSAFSLRLNQRVSSRRWRLRGSLLFTISFLLLLFSIPPSPSDALSLRPRCSVVYELTHLAAVSLRGNVNQSFMLADSIETSCPCCCTVRCFGPAGFVSELIYYDPIIIVLPAPSKSLTLVSCFYKRFNHYELASTISRKINVHRNQWLLSLNRKLTKSISPVVVRQFDYNPIVNQRTTRHTRLVNEEKSICVSNEISLQILRT